MDKVCQEHSGFVSSISSLQKNTEDQWVAITDLRKRVEGIMTRLNVILGGLTVAIIMAFINMIIEKKAG